MKKVVFVIFIALAVFLLPISAEDGELTEEIYTVDDFDTRELMDALPDELIERLPNGVLFDHEGFSGRYSLEYFFGIISDAISQAVSPALKMLSVTLGLVLLSSAISALKGLMKSDSLSSLFDFISRLCIMLALFGSLQELLELVSLYLRQLSGIVSAMVPLLIGISVAGGNLSGSVVSANSMMLSLAMIEALAAHILYPVLQICFGFLIVTGIGGMKLDGISKLVRSLFTWLLGFAAAFISAVMSFQSAISARADSLSMRAVKFAASSAIPVAGSIASDAVTTVAGSLSLVRTTVGTVGVIIIIVLTVPTIAIVLLSQLGVTVSQTAADVLGLENEKKLLSEMNGLIGFLAAVCVIAALMFTYALTVFAKTSVALA